MVATLAQSAQLKIHQALAQWQHWQCAPALASQPTVTRELAGGLSNSSLLVHSDNRAFVLRLDGHSPQRLGLSRNAEWRAHKNAAAHGLAPQPVYFNPELGILVSEYCEQDSKLLSGQQELEAIADLLRGIHALPAVKFRLQALDRAMHYLGVLGEKNLPAEFIATCKRLQQGANLCLCHNDLLRENRLQRDGRLLAIDWEYTALGDPWFDLAVICEGDALQEQQCLQLLEAWLQAPADAGQEQRLQDYRQVYRVLSTLWARLTTS
jgi:thiamine kinase